MGGPPPFDPSAIHSLQQRSAAWAIGRAASWWPPF